MASVDQRRLLQLPEGMSGRPSSVGDPHRRLDGVHRISIEHLLREEALDETAPSNERLLLNDLMRRVRRLENLVTVTYGDLATREREHQSAPLRSLLAALCEAAREARVAQELDERLDAIIGLKERVQEAIELAGETGPRHLKHALVMLRDGLSNTYAEDLTERQLEGLVTATARLAEGVDDLDAAMEVSAVLTDHDLDYIADLPDPES